MTHQTATLLEDGHRLSDKQYVFSFKEGDGKNKQLLGGKGANLCEMTQIG
jgi:pyruvate,orthophosphate dikinase